MENRYFPARFYLQIGLILGSLAMLAGLLVRVPEAQAGRLMQQPTVDVPTVTGTPLGPMASVNLDQHQIKVRSGPGFDYPEIGILVQGQTVPAYGSSPGLEWVQIGYHGTPGGMAWVHGSLVTLSKPVPVITPPPTPTPRVTPTLDPTLVARYLVEAPPTRLPTFTSPPPILVPTFSSSQNPSAVGRLPVGFVIIGLTVMGVFGMMLSFLRGR